MTIHCVYTVYRSTGEQPGHKFFIVWKGTSEILMHMTKILESFKR